MPLRDRLIVALDVETTAEARSLIGSLREAVGMFKVGSQLFTTVGPEIVREIVDSGCRVFLDLKFHDIPNQVSGSATAAAKLGVSMFTVHASGGSEMMRRAVKAIHESATSKGHPRPAIVAVTVLTSIDATALQQIGMGSNPSESVLRLVKIAEGAGVDGVVASPMEAKAIRSVVSRDFLIVTPGIRPSETRQVPALTGRSREDQKRVATPAAALESGADYLVVGRPITQALDPAGAARAILSEIENVAGLE
jgi:orotidine-5'-phosphate decarboxylase